MKALVLWATPTHPNLGVAALAVGSEMLLRKAFGPDIDVRFHATGGADLPGNDGPVNISHAGPLLMQRLRQPGLIRDWITSFDIILDTRAGDSFADIYTLKRLVKMTQIGLYARQWKVPLAFGPQTIGPFENVIGRALGKLSLRSANLVMARDHQSAEAAASLGRPVDLTATDVVFAIPLPPRDEKYDILFNPSGLLWNENPHVDHLRYQTLVRDTLIGLESQGRSVSLLAHVSAASAQSPDSDIVAVEAVRELISGQIVAPADLFEARVAVSSAQLVIGARMHACLNALSTGTPAIALAYSRKFSPLLQGVNWHHTLDLRDDELKSEDIIQLALQPDLLSQDVLAVRQRADELMEQAAANLRSVL